MNINRLNEFRTSLKLYRHYCKKLNEDRVADFPKKYVSKGTESHWNNVWERYNNFKPNDENKAALKMILPPPNITGVLHLGHALTVTIEDVLARWHKMRGGTVLWVPGLDHAGIATQVAVEKHLLAVKNLTRHDLGKEEFLSAVEKWKTEKSEKIIHQLKRLGSSLDWSRQYFTMSQKHNKAVVEAFVALNDRNLLYRNKSLINWCPALRSTISDIEVEPVGLSGKTLLEIPGYSKKVAFGEMVDVSFRLRDSSEEIVVATTRVESMFGDVAIAVHPEDSRYSRYINKEAWHPLREVFIPIIGDSAIKPDFGTGAMKVTPAHSYLDFEISLRHRLELIEVIGEDGKLTENCKNYAGMPRFIARTKILDQLSSMGAVQSIKDHPTTIPLCSRSGDVIEPLIKEQWFIKTREMAARAAEAVRTGKIVIEPNTYKQLWLDRMETNQDWCVSRQLWWGHRIPAYFCDSGSEKLWIVAKSVEEAREIGAKRLSGDFTVTQDPDVLDTWFSAALLPLSAMGWPDGSYSNAYPLNLMETGHDILFHWVARMTMLCTELTGEIPFEEVLLHGVLCDGHGKKMSKSRGNVILPEFVIDGISRSDLDAIARANFASGMFNKVELKRILEVNAKVFPNGIPDCGVDALRLTLCAHNVKNEKISFNVAECKTNKHFCNKIWQACRYILYVTGDRPIVEPDCLSTADKWILSRMATMVETVNDAFRQKNFYKAVQAIREFFHYEFCNIFIEITKKNFENHSPEVLGHQFTLVKCLEVTLRTIAPIMPYLSEDLYSRLKKKFANEFIDVPSLLETSYPTPEEFPYKDEELEEKFTNSRIKRNEAQEILSKM